MSALERHRELLEDARALLVLAHLKQAGLDYGLSISKRLHMRLCDVLEILESLERMGLIERGGASALKNTEARMKLSDEVRKHHTYYRLTGEGEEVLKEARDERRLARAYAGILLERRDLYEALSYVRAAGIDHAGTFARLLRRSVEEAEALLEGLERMGLVERVKEKTIKFGERKAKPKKETRTHHFYYRITRLGERALKAAQGGE